MQIFKTFLKIATRSLCYGFIYIGVFLGVSFSIAGAQSNHSTEFSADKISIAVIDRDKSALSGELYSYLDKTHNIKSIKDDKDAWLDELFVRTVEYVLVIEEGFEKQMTGDNYKNGLTSYTAPDSNTSYIVASQVESWLQNTKYYLSAGSEPGEAAKKASAISEISAEVSYLQKDGSIDKTTAISVFFTFMPYIMLCVLINSLGPVLLVWNRREIKARTAVSGVSLRSRNWGIIGALTVFSVILMGVFIGVSAIVYKKDFFVESTCYHVLNTLCYLTVSIAVTFLVSQLSKKTTTLSIWSNLLGLSTSFLCGVFVERSLLPDKVVAFSKCLPPYWYINVSEELRYYSGSLSASGWRSMGIQLLFAAAITAVAFVIVRCRQQKNT